MPHSQALQGWSHWEAAARIWEQICPGVKKNRVLVNFDPISLWNGWRRGDILGQRIKSVVAGVLCPWLKKWGQKVQLLLSCLGLSFQCLSGNHFSKDTPKMGQQFCERRRGWFFLLLCNRLGEILIPCDANLLFPPSCHGFLSQSQREPPQKAPKILGRCETLRVTFLNSMEVGDRNRDFLGLFPWQPLQVKLQSKMLGGYSCSPFQEWFPETLPSHGFWWQLCHACHFYLYTPLKCHPSCVLLPSLSLD